MGLDDIIGLATLLGVVVAIWIGRRNAKRRNTANMAAAVAAAFQEGARSAAAAHAGAHVSIGDVSYGRRASRATHVGTGTDDDDEYDDDVAGEYDDFRDRRLHGGRAGRELGALPVRAVGPGELVDGNGAVGSDRRRYRTPDPLRVEGALMSSDEAFAVLREDARRTASGIPWLPDRMRGHYGPGNRGRAWTDDEDQSPVVDGFGFVEGPDEAV